MDTKKYTDEELLSYVLNDCSNEFGRDVEASVKNDPELKKRLHFIGLLKGEVSSMTDASSLKSRRKERVKIIKSFSSALAIFFFGVVIGSTFEKVKPITINESKSEFVVPLSWDETKSLSIM
jgi:hypothetical protein